MADSNFVVKNTLVVNNSFFANSTQFFIGNTTTGTGGSLGNTTTIFVGNTDQSTFITSTGLNVNSSTIANTIGVYTLQVNAASHTTGTATSIGTGTGSLVANVTTLFIGNSTINTFVTSAGLNVNNATIANSSQVYSPLHTTGSTGTGTGGFLANNTTILIGNNTVNSVLTSAGLNVNAATIANNAGVYATQVNAASHTTGTATSITTGGGSLLANVTTLFIGNNSVNTFVTSAGLNVNNATIANNSGVYTTQVNAASHTTGTSTTITTGAGSLVANVTTLFIGNSTINTFVTSAGLNVNATTIANSSQVYSPLHTTGGLVTGTGGFLANSTTVYIGNNTVYSYSNSSHYLTSGTGTGTGGFLANNTTVYIGNNTVYSLANSSYFLTSGTGTGTGGFIANTSTVFVGNNTVFTVSNNSSFYTYGTGTGTGGLIANNSTLLIGNNTIYSYSNSSHYLTSGTGTGTGGFIANTTTIFIGNNTSYSLANNSSIYISGTLIANSTGPYGKTEGSLFVNKAFTSGGSYSDTFFTAGGVAENKIGVLYPSQSESFLYSNSTEWGLFSLSGGKIIYFNRGDSTVRTANLHNTRTTSLGVGVAATGIVGQIKATSIYVDNGSFGNSETYGVYIDANQINASVVKNDVAEIAINYSGYLAGTTQFRNLNVFDGKNNSIAFFDGASGNFTAAGNVTAYSDIKLKTNVETISGALEKVLNMRGVMFNRKDTGARGTGVIAQEIQQVLPEVVVEGKDNLSVAYGNIVGVLIEAIKELEKKVKEMEKK